MFKVREYGPDTADNVVFMFSGAGVPAWQLELPFLPLWYFKKAGWKVFYYHYPFKVVLAADLYLQTVQGAYADAAKRLAELPSDKNVLVAGVSLGSLPATKLAVSSRRVKGLVLNVPYADPITNLFDFGPTHKVPKDYVEKFLASRKLEDVEKAASPFSPLQNAHRLKHVKVLLFVARRDRIFLYRHSQKLRDALQLHVAQFKCLESEKLGHWLGASKYNLQSSKWLHWLGF